MIRLLNVHTFEFQEFHSSDVPQCIITSHRWVAGHEASYKDILKRRNTHNTGYRKIQLFAKFIRSKIPGMDWMWIDTCCIQQDSSQEVSEAINSMLKWYRNAVMCLAYLADVHDPYAQRSFARSGWFRRGWTLQELLAPQHVVFITSNGIAIGAKTTIQGSCVLTSRSLHKKVQSITGIPENLLLGYSRSEGVSVEERLAWMANRQTTREEDESYCLLGLLGVNVSVRYGEGREEARKRLLRKVKKATGDTATTQHYEVQVQATTGDWWKLNMSVLMGFHSHERWAQRIHFHLHGR
ncbi:uncharacterized protein LTR77_005832 [Saxophila tyrrhenica]|uniref:Heterokaryon incompatibility domain-containing protein n=1 Tax=Saxophila tyrrhenica TaxID=1690608 RepID=A0AAV9PD23_9PEZI|nr:hypothetical protein LTR77_005832 [Saxophila tyrrhenica]